MLGSLYSDRPIAVSPTLASSIGLENAVMVHVLAELQFFRPVEQLANRPGLDFVLLGEADLARHFPFWKLADIERIRAQLIQLDMLEYEPHAEHDGSAWYALQRLDSPPRRTSAVRRRRTSTGPIPPDWQPDEGWISQCRQHDIPEDFIRAQRDRFVLIWQERGESRFSWGNEFVREVLRRWREEQSAAGARERFSDMGRQWQPDAVAVEILLRDGVNDNFIKDAIPEFVLYWTEKGVMQDAWNSKFIAHVQRQWLRLRSAELDGKTPRPLAADWKPNAACLEILQMARIDEGWALQELAEFVLYWRDTGEARESWNIIFLQRMKQLWAQRLKRQELEEANARPELAGGSVEADDQAWRQRVSDRSWAE